MYVALVAIFGAAWFADEFPSIAPFATLIAVLVVLAQVAIFVSSRRSDGLSARASGASKDSASASKDVAWRSYEDFEARRVRALIMHRERLRDVRARAARSELDYLFLATIFDQTSSQKRPAFTELSKWTLTEHRPGLFNIAAGTFEITFIDGRTHIHVIDRSKVSVVVGGASEQMPEAFVDHSGFFELAHKH
jgi:hypothetical protein